MQHDALQQCGVGVGNFYTRVEKFYTAAHLAAAQQYCRKFLRRKNLHAALQQKNVGIFYSENFPIFALQQDAVQQRGGVSENFTASVEKIYIGDGRILLRHSKTHGGNGRNRPYSPGKNRARKSVTATTL